MVIGVLVDLNDRIEASIERVSSLGLRSCQLCNWNTALYTPEMAQRVREACDAHDVRVSTLWAGWSGPKVWNLVEGPLTLGLLPEEFRAQRVEDLKRGGDFAELIGVSQIATHAGFIPENPNEPGYSGMIDALREVAEYYGAKGQFLLFETGQETPVTLKRAFEDIGRDNLGVNLDPANLMMYGKANPVDALGLLGPYVMDVHVKDGGYPTTGRELGLEYAVGKGKVDFCALIKTLRDEYHFDGALTIEREISGEEQTRDILTAKAYLETLIAG